MFDFIKSYFQPIKTALPLVDMPVSLNQKRKQNGIQPDSKFTIDQTL